MSVIFDLDQTLINSQSAQTLRHQLNWKGVYSLIPTLPVYDGISSLIQHLNASNIKVAIVTKAPRPYCERIINQWSWAVDATVCYHDCPGQQKPHPAPIQKAMERMGVLPEETISIGDSDTDILSSRAAGVFAIACTWGTLTETSLLATNPDLIVRSVAELSEYITNRYNK